MGDAGAATGAVPPERGTSWTMAEIAAIAAGFVLLAALQWTIVAHDLSTRSAPDLLASAFPVLWMDAALLVFTAFSLGVLRSSRIRSGSTREGRLVGLFSPDFEAMRRAFATAPFRKWAFPAGLAYLALVLWLEGVLAVDPSGHVLPREAPYPDLITLEGSYGWAPALYWVPNPFFAVTLRPSTVAGGVLLALLASASFGLIACRRKLRIGDTGRRRGSPESVAAIMALGAALGAAPASAYFMGLLVPGSGLTSGPAEYERTAWLSLALLALSVSIMWVAIGRLTRLEWPSAAAPTPTGAAAPQRPAAAWALLLALALAVLALVLDLGGAPRGGDEGHEQLAAVGHPASAFFAAVAGIVAVSVGVALSAFPFAHGRRLVAFKVGLVGLYVDGLIHWLAVLEHLWSGPEVAFFLACGAAQVIAVWPGGRFPTFVWMVGIPFSVALIVLYFLTRLLPNLFQLHAEPFEALGTLSKATEIVVLASLGAAFDHRQTIQRLKKTVVDLRARSLSRLA